MDRKDFLFELGVEEIPVAYIADSVKTIRDFFESSLKQANLEFDDLKIFSTPRRFAIIITSLQTQQEDKVIERIGPTKEVAYDASGKLTKAALGFLRGAGAEERDITLKQTHKGEKIAVKKEIKGLSSITILKDLIKNIITEIKFKKTMKWGNLKTTFARPIRWLLVLFGDDIIDLEFDSVKSGNITFGNRFQKLDNPVEINSIDEYESKLKDVFVIPDRKKRKQILIKQMAELFTSLDEEVIEDNKLLETVTDLVEYPTAVIGEFDKKYLTLPKKVVTSTLSEHQKYFSVSRKGGKLSNKFLFISNGDPNYSNLIKLGNEKVITARLEDAEFFYREDTAQPLETFVQKLSEVTFQQKLGSVLEKTERMVEISKYICAELKLDNNIIKMVLRGARLCKADLVTQMLGEKEFTKLQGYIGHQYALKSGEEMEIALAIEEHYQNGDKKISLAGSVIAIADKIDTICGIIGAGLLPTGSKDPFALRRAANGVVQIISNNEFEIDIHKLINRSFELLKVKLDKPENNIDVVYDFFKQRVNWLLKQKQIDYDIIESVMHLDHSNISDLVHRAEALQKLKTQQDFIKLVLGFKRVSNIIAEVKSTPNVKQELLKEEKEEVLYMRCLVLEKEIFKLLPQKNYQKIIEMLVQFGSVIDGFFDDVLVNVKNEEIKQNRYNILTRIRELFLQVADLSKLVVEGERK